LWLKARFCHSCGKIHKKFNDSINLLAAVILPPMREPEWHRVGMAVEAAVYTHSRDSAVSISAPVRRLTSAARSRTAAKR